MKAWKLLTAVIAGVTLLSMTPADIPPTPADGGIEFYSGSWDEALALAQKENKIVFLDAYATWCGPCRVLKGRVFTNPDVGSYFNESFVNMAIDMERGEGPLLARKFRVTAYPTLIFVKPDGTVVKKAVGFHQPDQLIQLGKAANSASSL